MKPMTPDDYITAARVPETLKPQSFGLWTIKRVSLDRMRNPPSPFASLNFQLKVGFRSYTLLLRQTMATLHLRDGEVVMEDSARELRKHLPIWLNAEGRVLVTGLGLGCVVRGLLASPRVTQISVVEIDPQIIRVVGHEFCSNPRVRLIRGDAFKVQLRDDFDFAWHDLWTEGEPHLQVLHSELLQRFHSQAKRQGAWELPRWVKRQSPEWVLR
jgi:hypothetical protein